MHKKIEKDGCKLSYNLKKGDKIILTGMKGSQITDAIFIKSDCKEIIYTVPHMFSQGERVEVHMPLKFVKNVIKTK